MLSGKTIGVIGIGYVGLLLAVTFGRKFQTIGFDVKREAIENYRKKVNLNGEVDEAGFEAARYLSYTTDPKKPTADLTPSYSRFL
jgi:UDP-N-acetyl-D-glucosamine/UDP-N-acetyl-D-galactosamine dehydrogenase